MFKTEAIDKVLKLTSIKNRVKVKQLDDTIINKIERVLLKKIMKRNPSKEFL